MARWSYKAELEEARRLRARAPRAAQLSEALFDLAREHRSEALETLAIEVDGAHCQTGREISEADAKAVVERAARVLGETGRTNGGSPPRCGHRAEATVAGGDES